MGMVIEERLAQVRVRVEVGQYHDADVPWLLELLGNYDRLFRTQQDIAEEKNQQIDNLEGQIIQLQELVGQRQTTAGMWEAAFRKSQERVRELEQHFSDEANS